LTALCTPGYYLPTVAGGPGLRDSTLSPFTCTHSPSRRSGPASCRWYPGLVAENRLMTAQRLPPRCSPPPRDRAGGAPPSAWRGRLFALLPPAAATVIASASGGYLVSEGLVQIASSGLPQTPFAPIGAFTFSYAIGVTCALE